MDSLIVLWKNDLLPLNSAKINQNVFSNRMRLERRRSSKMRTLRLCRM